VPQILTLNEVADFLGVGTPAVAAWARDGLLPACARSESGELLFYRWRVERQGPTLAASELVRFSTTNRQQAEAMLHDGRRLSCGCVLEPISDQPGWLCFKARELQSVARLTSAVASAAPGDALLRRLASGTAKAFEQHLASAKPPLREGEADHA
jgi:hypothetical protein